jgi:cytoskeletal protein CcmA (bactofilin family)
MFKYIVSVCLVLVSAIPALATAKIESGSITAQSIVAYGKTSGGVLAPLSVDVDGKLYTSGEFSGDVTVSGNVGIGNTAPTGSLEITNETTMPSLLVSSSSTLHGDKFIVTAGGNVGINTSSPTNTLEVVGNIYGTGSLAMAGAGNVGIGTTTASQTLTVSGSFTVSGNSTLAGNIATAGTFTSSNATSLGWNVVTATATTGVAACTNACAFCISSSSTVLQSCSNTITGTCVCAGAN